jgi:hypothetical protein
MSKEQELKTIIKGLKKYNSDLADKMLTAADLIRKYEQELAGV